MVGRLGVLWAGHTRGRLEAPSAGHTGIGRLEVLTDWSYRMGCL
ncbi:hypothetical protein [Streptomyces sp. SLBN-8D4]